MRIAFKEWAVVVDALGCGDQIIILRKGGISEGRGGFQVEHNRFLLFPTLFHQQRESVLPAAQVRYDALAPQLSSEVVRIEYFAEVADWKFLDTLDVALRLRGQHIWRDEVIHERFDWGKSRSIYAMALRVFRLSSLVELPMRAEYGGCKSWVELESFVQTDGAQPVLMEREFQGRLQRFQVALETTVESGEHTRPRVFRPAPSPVGSGTSDRAGPCEVFEPSGVAGEAPATAPEAGALPKPTAAFRRGD